MGCEGRDIWEFGLGLAEVEDDLGVEVDEGVGGGLEGEDGEGGVQGEAVRVGGVVGGVGVHERGWDSGVDGRNCARARIDCWGCR